MSIPREELRDGHWYRGHSRNFDLARWEESTGAFVGTRRKFESSYDERIGYGNAMTRGFRPVEDCGPGEKPHEHEWEFSDEPHGNSKWHEFCTGCSDIRDCDGYHKKEV